MWKVAALLMTGKCVAETDMEEQERAGGLGRRPSPVMSLRPAGPPPERAATSALGAQHAYARFDTSAVSLTYYDPSCSRAGSVFHTRFLELLIVGVSVLTPYTYVAKVREHPSVMVRDAFDSEFHTLVPQL